MDDALKEALTESDEELLLDELKEVAHVDEDAEDKIVVFASPSELAAIGTHVVTMLGSWLLDRRRQRRARAAAAGSNQLTETIN